MDTYSCAILRMKYESWKYLGDVEVYLNDYKRVSVISIKTVAELLAESMRMHSEQRRERAD